MHPYAPQFWDSWMLFQQAFLGCSQEWLEPGHSLAMFLQKMGTLQPVDPFQR